MASSSSCHDPPPSPHAAPLPLTMPSTVPCCPELDLSVSLSPALKTGPSPWKPPPLKQSNQSQLRINHCRRKSGTQMGSRKQSAVIATAKPHNALNRDTRHQQPIRGQRRTSAHHHAPAQLMDPPTSTSSQNPGCLEMAELNTTLALKAELQSLQVAEFNSQKVVKETLQRSERTKNLINARATEVVNVSRSQVLFSSLVSIDVHKDQLISQVLQEKLLLAPPSCSSSEIRPSEGPSLFFTPFDMPRQNPLRAEEEPAKIKPHPSVRPAHSVFDLYRRQRCWEVMP
ncbi:protein phosphatase 1 regulatory subunit 35 [Pholidichthys leucotaenia]